MRKPWNSKGNAIWRCLNRWVNKIDPLWDANKYDYAEILGIFALLMYSLAVMTLALGFCIWILCWSMAWSHNLQI